MNVREKWHWHQPNWEASSPLWGDHPRVEVQNKTWPHSFSFIILTKGWWVARQSPKVPPALFSYCVNGYLLHQSPCQAQVLWDMALTWMIQNIGSVWRCCPPEQLSSGMFARSWMSKQLLVRPGIQFYFPVCLIKILKIKFEVLIGKALYLRAVSPSLLEWHFEKFVCIPWVQRNRKFCKGRGVFSWWNNAHPTIQPQRSTNP